MVKSNEDQHDKNICSSNTEIPNDTKRKKNILKAIATSVFFFALPGPVAAGVGFLELGITVAKKSESKKTKITGATLYASSFVLPNPVCEVANVISSI